jgi:AraC-like DNA-binding protein
VLEQYGRVKFLIDNDLHSTLLKTKPETEFLHFLIVRSINNQLGKLNTDNLVMELVETVLNNLTDYRLDHKLNSSLKKNHLITIEKAKEYITQNYTNDISLAEISSHCCVSPFHFSRIFKTFTSYSPHQFLLNIRLKNSELLLRNTSLPVADIAFSSGFNSIEHFASAFRKIIQYSPSSL